MAEEMALNLTVSAEQVAELCRRHRIRELSLFGSAARNELRPESDIDLLVEFFPEAKVSLIGHLAAESEFAALFGRRVDLVSKRAIREPLRQEILPQARLLYAA